jgi:UDP-N-acetyl-2-amino-2-deoxyglucuronate dehydrogenase
MFQSAIIGCGNIGPHHAKCYQSTTEIKLAAVVDVVEEKAKKLAETYNVPYYTDVKKVLRRKDIDFIDVCVPSGLHNKIAIAAARAGKHVISEKPMDVTPQQCDKMIRTFAKYGVTYGGIVQHRFADDTKRTKAAIDAGRLGRITCVKCHTPWYRSQEYYDSGDWRGTWKLDGGGCLMNQGIHAIDLLVWLVGPIKTVWARTAKLAHERIEVEDVAVAMVEFESGALGAIMGSTASFPGSPVQHEITGTLGTIYLTDDIATRWLVKDELDAGKGDGATKAAEGPSASTQWSGLATDIFVHNIDDIARAVREGRTPMTCGAEHRKAVEVICAIYKSAKTGRPVPLPLKSFKP